MQRNTLIIVMVAAGSAMCWWPKIIPPHLYVPGWTPLILIALITGLGTALSDEGSAGWLMVASIVGVVAGIFCGFKIWWPTDRIDQSVVSFSIGLASLISIPVSVVAVGAGVVVRESRIAKNNRRLIWCVFLICFALAPTFVVLTPLLVILRK
jgi:hypothetical protein